MTTVTSIKQYIYSATCILGILTFAACDLNSGSGSEPQLNIMETAQSYSELERFVEAVEDAELESVLTGTGPYTVFPPTNEAFDNLPDEMRDTLSNDQMAGILEYHIIEDEFYGSDFEERQALETREGGNLYFVLDDSIYVNDTTAVIAGNIQATNGLVHAVDQVLLPDRFLPVFDIIGKRYALQTFEEGIREAEMASMLQEDHEEGYTVFVAPESVFEEQSLPDDPQELESQLSYHIAPGKIAADDLVDGQTIETVHGKEISIGREGDTITINGNAVVTEPDLAGTNGIVHIIDALLDPSAEQ
ncbi:fasciclin domain-containing protein [Halalkalibaculum sp. DA3122]|uniref:fasciclin domain-containing protein n=1 Tax=Halalkalibaculum sp. DA3122 TaxID=3373607 RepID=UPI0037543B7E